MLNHQTAHELLRVLAYPKFGLTSVQVDSIAALYLRYAERVEQSQNRADLPVCRDTDDQMFIRLAAAGQAELLVTGDKDLLELLGETPFIIETLAEYRSRFR